MDYSLPSFFVYLVRGFFIAQDEQVRKDGGVPSGNGDGWPFTLVAVPEGHRSLR